VILEKSGSKLEDFDITIASHTLAQGAVLVTDKVKQMKRIRGLKIENWKGRTRQTLKTE